MLTTKEFGWFITRDYQAEKLRTLEYSIIGLDFQYHLHTTEGGHASTKPFYKVAPECHFKGFYSAFYANTLMESTGGDQKHLPC